MEMINDNLSNKQDLNDKFLIDILGLEESEVKQTASNLNIFLSPELIRRLNCFFDFISKDEQFIAQFKNHINLSEMESTQSIKKINENR